MAWGIKYLSDFLSLAALLSQFARDVLLLTGRLNQMYSIKSCMQRPELGKEISTQSKGLKEDVKSDLYDRKYFQNLLNFWILISGANMQKHGPRMSKASPWAARCRDTVHGVGAHLAQAMKVDEVSVLQEKMTKIAQPRVMTDQLQSSYN